MATETINKAVSVPGPLDVKPDNRTVQACCLAYGGNSFSGPMKEALVCHLSILKSRHPEMNAAPDMLAALRSIIPSLEARLTAKSKDVEAWDLLNAAKATIDKAEK
jgi:hypothetical protein